MKSILIVEDDITYGMMLKTWLGKKGFQVQSASSIARAQKIIETEDVDLILSDLRLPDRDGIDLLKWLGQHGRMKPLIIMTGYADIQSAVQAMKLGARDYVAKPVNPDELLKKMDEALKTPEPGNEAPAVVRQEKAAAGKETTTATNPPSDYLEGESDAAKQLYNYVRLVAPTSMSVLINGASGTGKEYVAHRIHQLSKRAQYPFVAIDCGAIPKEVAASEFFGYKKGAFTGATEHKTGMFAAANRGTLFLDEVGNLNAEVQRSLLRALQEKRYRPVGGREEMQTDIRLVAATNENLEKAIAEGRFREDLFHRLNEFPLHVPLLAECPEDIIPLAEFMLDAANRELERNVKGFDREAQKRLKAYPWPGNIRELRTVVRRATLLAKDGWITATEIGLPGKDRQPEVYSLNDERAERATILKALGATGNDKKAAARLLGISRSTLYLKLKKYRLD